MDFNMFCIGYDFTCKTAEPFYDIISNMCYTQIQCPVHYIDNGTQGPLPQNTSLSTT
jgi:hypothetical protein